MKAINTDLPVRISEPFANLLASIVKDVDGHAVTLNFRDESYSAEAGGYRPVEIRLEWHSEQWQINYITEFCYVGTGHFAELAKAIDFDFGSGIFQTNFGVFAIEIAQDMYTIWEPNFMSYYEMGVFKTTVTPE
ncbi:MULTISPECIES: DUF2787 family protein [Shewanella]|uniref:DUF2787 family protein n=1 Tax=Shewanella TaxID=22 RepID=UPI0011820A91|nr:DUF2787 family protein [Shewanella sp. KCT]TVP09305.1 hypothetical protein AYI87_20205 [Shewanella sp. KCT]